MEGSRNSTLLIQRCLIISAEKCLYGAFSYPEQKLKTLIAAFVINQFDEYK